MKSNWLTFLFGAKDFHLISSTLNLRVNNCIKTVTLLLTEQIKSRLDKLGALGAEYLDLHKVFDLFNHDVLILRLPKSRTLTWRPSYLSGRIKCVQGFHALFSDMRCKMGSISVRSLIVW